MHTAHHIAKRCLAGDISRGRTIILVTHHITLCLPVASYLVKLSRGTVLYHGSVPDLLAQGRLQHFTQMEGELKSPPPINSRISKPNEPQPKKSGNKLIHAESYAVGRVSKQTYLAYIRAAGIHLWILTVILLLLARGIEIAKQVRFVLDHRGLHLIQSSVFLGEMG